MKFIISIMRNIIPKELPTCLGRWRIEYCKVKINNIVKLANEDHCGSCSQYSLDKINYKYKQYDIKILQTKFLEKT
jgi:hypothetical protein